MDTHTTTTSRPRPGWLPPRPQRLVVCALLAVVVAALAGIVSLRGPALHESRVSLVIDQPLALAAASDAGLLDKLARIRVKYADLVPTPDVSGPAAEELGLEVDQVAGSVAARLPDLSLRLDVVARDRRADDAVAIANAVSEALVGYVDSELENVGVEPAMRYRFRILAPARSAVQVEPDSEEAFRLAVSLGLLALGTAYVVFELLETALWPPRRT